MIEITSLDEKYISEFSTLRDKALKNNNSLIADSEKVVLKLLNSSFAVTKLLCTPDFFHANEELIKSNVDSDKIFVAQKKLMEGITGFNLHHGVMCLAVRPQDSDLSELDDKIIILNGLTSPENVGAIVRTAAAFNINSIITDKKSCSPYLRRAVRVSMGNIFAMKTHHADNIVKTIESLKNSGYEVIGTANHSDSKNIKEFSFKQKTAIVIGSEGWGMDDEVSSSCSMTMKIPMNENVAHLNAAVAASIFLYSL